jgi:hypothetical protein
MDTNSSRLNLNEKREMLRKNFLKHSVNSNEINLKENVVKREKDSRITPKINKIDKNDSRVSTHRPVNVAIKKEDSINNIRFKGIFERNATDNTTP